MSNADDVLLEYVERVERVAAERERAAIVAWLREDVDLDKREALFIAGCIESGVHLRGDDD